MNKTITPRDRRLAAELRYLQKLAQDSSMFHFNYAQSDPFPEEYDVVFTCKGLIHKPSLTGESVLRCIGSEYCMHIYLPAEYPLVPPKIYLKTSVFHPNIKYKPDWEAELTQQFGGAERRRRALLAQSELQEQEDRAYAHLVCLDGIKLPKEKGIYVPRLTLYDICRELGEMIMFQRYNVSDPMDPYAAKWTKWAEKEGNILPIDDRLFLDNLEIEEIQDEFDLRGLVAES